MHRRCSSSALSFHILRGTEWGAAMPPAAQPPDAMSHSGFPGCRTISQHLNDLKKENFSLKLRIYFLEEKIQQKFEESADGVHKRVSEKANDACEGWGEGNYHQIHCVCNALEDLLYRHQLCSQPCCFQSCRLVFDRHVNADSSRPPAARQQSVTHSCLWDDGLSQGETNRYAGLSPRYGAPKWAEEENSLWF